MCPFVSLSILIVIYVPFCVFCLIVLFCVLFVCKCIVQGVNTIAVKYKSHHHHFRPGKLQDCHSGLIAVSKSEINGVRSGFCNGNV
jgi:hypothetical protein